MNYSDQLTNDIMKFDLECRSLWRAYEMVDIKHDDMIDRVKCKLFLESGTYEDAIILYEEANKETNTNKEGIITRIKNAIKRFFAKIKAFFTGEKSADINKLEDNKDYSIPGSVKEFMNHHFSLKGIVKDFNAWMDGGFKELPQTMKNARNLLLFGAGGAAGGVMAGKKIKEVYNYAKGDVDAVHKLNDSLTNKISAIEAKDEEDKSWIDNAKKWGYECIQEVLSSETKFLNGIIGSVFGKVEGVKEKINEKSAEHIENTKQYKDLVEKESKGTITDDEKKKLDKMREKIENKRDKASEHATNKENLSGLKDIGNISKNLSKIEKDIKKAKDKLASGKINKENANNIYNSNNNKFNDIRKIFNQEKNKGKDSRISKPEIKEIETSIGNIKKLLKEFNNAINGNKSSNSSNSNSSNKSSNNTTNSSDTSGDSNSNDNSNDNNNDNDNSSTNNNNTDNSDNSDSDSESNDNDEDEDSDNVEAWKVTKDGDGYKVKSQASNFRGTMEQLKSNKKRKKTLKKMNAKDIGLKNKDGMVWVYESYDDDWFDIDVDTNPLFESYSGALDDELMDIFSEL